MTRWGPFLNFLDREQAPRDANLRSTVQAQGNSEMSWMGLPFYVVFSLFVSNILKKTPRTPFKISFYIRKHRTMTTQESLEKQAGKMPRKGFFLVLGRGNPKPLWMGLLAVYTTFVTCRRTSNEQISSPLAAKIDGRSWKGSRAECAP